MKSKRKFISVSLLFSLLFFISCSSNQKVDYGVKEFAEDFGQNTVNRTSRDNAETMEYGIILIQSDRRGGRFVTYNRAQEKSFSPNDWLEASIENSKYLYIMLGKNDSNGDEDLMYFTHIPFNRKKTSNKVWALNSKENFENQNNWPARTNIDIELEFNADGSIFIKRIRDAKVNLDLHDILLIENQDFTGQIE